MITVFRARGSREGQREPGSGAVSPLAATSPGASFRRALARLVTAALVAPMLVTLGAGAAQAADVTVPQPAVKYDFNDVSTSVIANSGTAGSALNARLKNATTLARGTGATPASGASGVLPGAPQGQTTAPYLEVPNGVFTGANALSVSTWIKWDGQYANQNPWAYIIGSDALPADNWGTYLTPSEDGKSRATANSGTEVKADDQVPLPANKWTLITTTLNGTSMSYYLNGALVRTEAVNIDFSRLTSGGSTRSGLIGRVPWSGPFAATFPGAFDDFSIYREALSADQVGQLYRSYTGDVTSVSQSTWAVTTPVGVQPALPANLQATYSSGMTAQLPITWDPIPAAQYQTAGTSFDVKGAVPGWTGPLTTRVTVQERQTESIVADFAQPTGQFRGGASGTLYGFGDEQSPTQALVNGAAITNTSQKPPLGTQHPGGDVFDIEDTFFAKNGKELYVYTQDYYPDWPYFGGQRPGDDLTFTRGADGVLTGAKTQGGNGVWDYLEILEVVTERIAANADDPDKYVLIPFNEPDWIWYSGDKRNKYLIDGKQPDSFTPGGIGDWEAAHDVITAVYAKHGLQKPRIAGPGDSIWMGSERNRYFLKAAVAQGTVPDVFVWHELNGYVWLPQRAAEARQDFLAAGIPAEKAPSINITEYGASTDMSSPYNLLRWFSGFEAAKVDAQTAYWTASGTLSDNQAKVNDANGGWWLFKWYGDMTGSTTAKVTTGEQKAIAAFDKVQKRGQVLFGGTTAGKDASVTINGIDPAVFGTSVDVEVREANVNGVDGVSGTPPVVTAIENAAITDGTLAVRVPSSAASSVYQLVFTPSQARDVTAQKSAQADHYVMEAENSALTSAEIRTPSGYRASNEKDVRGFDKVGSKAEWTVAVAKPGLYRLQVLGASPGVPVQHALFIDGAFNQKVQWGASAMKPFNVQSVARGSAEVLVQLSAGTHVLGLRTSQDGTTLLPNAGYSRDNASGVTLDRFDLTRVGDTVNTESQDYPASSLRLFGGAALDFAAPATAGWAKIGSTGRVDAYPAAYESGYYDVAVSWKGAAAAKLELTVNGRVAASFTAKDANATTSTVRVHLPEGISELELRSSTGALVDSIRTTRAVDGDAAITRIEAESSTITRGGTAVVKTFGTGPTDGLATNGSGTGYVTGLGITDAVKANQGTLTVPRSGSFAKAGEYDVTVHYSNDDIEGTHSYNPQVVDAGLQATEQGSSALVGRSTFRYTYLATNFWEARMSMALGTDSAPITFGNTRETLYIDEGPTGSTDDDRVLPGYAIAPDVDWIEFAPFVIDATAPTPTVETVTTTSSRCVSAKSVLTVKVQNEHAAPITVKVTTPYGVKTHTDVAPGAFGTTAYTTRLKSMPAGTATVEATAVIGGKNVTTTTTTPYTARVC